MNAPNALLYNSIDGAVEFTVNNLSHRDLSCTVLAVTPHTILPKRNVTLICLSTANLGGVASVLILNIYPVSFRSNIHEVKGYHSPLISDYFL